MCVHVFVCVNRWMSYRPLVVILLTPYCMMKICGRVYELCFSKKVRTCVRQCVFACSYARVCTLKLWCLSLMVNHNNTPAKEQ